MPSNGRSGFAYRPSRISRIDLGADDDDLDYSDQPGPSTRPRPPPSTPHAPPRHDPRASRSNNPYHDLEQTTSYTPPPPHRQHRAEQRLPPTTALSIYPRSTPSPEPDKDVLAYIRAQEQDSISNKDAKLAELLKREKFQHGAGKVKSRVQKEREAEERKRKQAQEDAAKAYDEFVAAMGGDTSDNHSALESGNGRKKVVGFVGVGGKAYVGSRSDSSTTVKTIPPEDTKEQVEGGGRASLKRFSTAFGEDESADESVSVSPPRKESQRKRHHAMDSFLTELQTEQAERESRLSSLASATNKSISTLLAHETLGKPGSRDLGSDSLTTNICIVSLPPNVDERGVGEFFRVWGDVATVKIMWPRGEQRERVGGLTGFVAYMTRTEAEQAFKEADGALWGGTRIKLSWGKAMVLPSRAMYPMSREKRKEQGLDRASKSNIPKLIIRHRQHDRTCNSNEELRQRVEESYPETQRLLIETVASRIRSNGAHFEHILRERETDNPKFAFLHDTDSILHHYFRVCLDPTYTQPSKSEAEFSDAGSDELYSTDSGEESENERMGLGTLSRRRLCCMLRGLTLRRERIARVTAFALDHAADYPTVVALLTASLLQPATPVPRKLARLYALSDILHNSGTPISNAWRYRATLESQLPLVFAHLGQVALSFPGRIKREEFRAKVMHVLQVWESWIVVGPHVLERVKRLFDRPPITITAAATIQEQETSEKPSSPSLSLEEEDLDGEAL